MDIKALQQQRKAEDAKKNIFTYDKYKYKLQEGVRSEYKKEKYERKFSKDLILRKDLEKNTETDILKLPILISPELTVIWEQIKREKNSKKAQELVEEFLKKEKVCQEIQLNKRFEYTASTGKTVNIDIDKIWFGTTENGIDIRPGLVSVESEPIAVRLGDDCVHALMAGRTGSGKSNALHVIITSLMYEYAPWELNINLADFKIVELSKYGNAHYEDNGTLYSAAAPHVEKIAATDSMEYVLSVMYDMYEKMDIRQKVFAALGFQKLSQYRQKYGVVLPREILIVDEFQQMYELATPKQADKINQLIKMITKLGRATGYHLLFASQSMSGTVRSDVLSNFKLRLCLPADENVSSMVLGNKAASELTGSKSKGYLIANGEGGAVDYNIEYKVPLIRENEEEGTGDLADTLKENAILARKLGYQKSMDFYREETVRQLWRGEDSQESTFEGDLEKFYHNTRDAVANKEDVEDYLLLGDSCVYTRTHGKNSSLEYAPLQIADRKNILCIGDSIYQRAYMMELLALQYAKREEGRNANYVVHGDSMVRSLLKLPGFSVEREFAAKDFTGFIRQNYLYRSVIRRFVQLPQSERIPENIPEEIRNILWEVYKKGIGEDGEFHFKKIKTLTFWVNGYHMLDDMLQEWGQHERDKASMEEILKNATNVGMRFILIGTKVTDLPSAIAKNFEYRFLMSNDESNYVKSGMQYPKEYKEEILRFKAMNEALNRQKPGLYILPQDEKLVKMFGVDMESRDRNDTSFFEGIL